MRVSIGADTAWPSTQHMLFGINSAVALANTRMPAVGLLGKDSLINVADPKHRYLRGLLSPAFTPEAVAGYLPQIVDLMSRHLKEWADAGEEGVKGFDSFKLLTFEFIVQV